MNEAQEKNLKIMDDRFAALRDVLRACPATRLVSIALTDLEKLELIAAKAVTDAYKD